MDENWTKLSEETLIHPEEQEAWHNIDHPATEPIFLTPTDLGHLESDFYHLLCRHGEGLSLFKNARKSHWSQ